ncbi:hypothetical protein HGRIS_004102 [Hohenbuehelia grisea]|uniref:Uncharacterized protein n=1 Tax=Hohenbuehelia grisea TaxID=104357 RepID=A0ABR3JHN9_9AGAR
MSFGLVAAYLWLYGIAIGQGIWYYRTYITDRTRLKLMILITTLVQSLYTARVWHLSSHNKKIIGSLIFFIFLALVAAAPVTSARGSDNLSIGYAQPIIGLGVYEGEGLLLYTLCGPMYINAYLASLNLRNNIRDIGRPPGSRFISMDAPRVPDESPESNQLAEDIPMELEDLSRQHPDLEMGGPQDGHALGW